MSDQSGSQSQITVWVLASSPVLNSEAEIAWLPKPDRVVAADGGSMLAERLGLTPDLIIGDLDSADPALVREWEAADVEVKRYKHTEKLETDTELAVLEALQWRPARIYVLGATGGRLDHEIANILLLTHPQLAALDVRIVDGRQEIFLAKPGRWNNLAGEPGDTLSLVPLGGDVEGVKTEGLEYPLHRENLLQGRGRGVSNRFLAENARVVHESGLMLVVHLHTGPENDIQGET